MKEYIVKVKTKRNDVFMEIINRISNYDCDISIDKKDEIDTYAMEINKESFHKLGEKHDRTLDEIKEDYTYQSIAGDLLKSYGLSEKHKGFNYAIECIRIINLHGLGNFTLDSDIYPVVSKWYNTSPSSVEHNIRNAIGQSWEKANKTDSKTEMNKFNERPTNLIFLKHVAEKINCTVYNA